MGALSNSVENNAIHFPRFDPASLFAKYRARGFLFSGLNPSTGKLWTTSDKTTLVASAGDNIGYAKGLDPAGNDASQATSSFRPTLQQRGNRWVIDWDGLDDYLATSVPCATSTTYIEVGTPDPSINGVIVGVNQGGGRFNLAVSQSNGVLGGGCGSQNSSVISDGQNQDLRGVRCGKAISMDGTTVKLFKNAGSGFVNCYSGALSGAAVSSLPVWFGSWDNGGIATAFYGGDTELILVIQAALRDEDIAAVMAAALNS